MKNLTKKTKKEHDNYEKDINEPNEEIILHIRNECTDYKKEIEEFCKEIIIHLKNECINFEKEIHKKALELDEELSTIKEVKIISLRIGTINYY